MLKGVPPTKVGKDREKFAASGLLVVFVESLDQMYDSLQEGADLPSTIFFKVMTLLGGYLKHEDVWIEETRSMAVKVEEK
jgi:hypothetical protein